VASYVAGPPLASFGRRVGAWFVDAMASGILGAIVLVLVGGFDSSTDTSNGFRFEVSVNGIGTLALLVVSMLWYVVPQGARGQTIGKLILGIKVVRADDPSRTIGFGLSLGRWIVTQVLLALCIVPGIVDHLIPLRDDRRQTLHDRAVGSIVVRVV
jgi:uncharacterized RDD family membrane protein YckC